MDINAIAGYVVWNKIDGGPAMAYRRDAHWLWQAGSVMTVVQGRKQSVRNWLYSVFGGVAEFHFTTSPPQTVMGPACGVENCVNPWHAREMTRREFYECTALPKDVLSNNAGEQHLLMGWERTGVPASVLEQLRYLFEYSEIPRADGSRDTYEDADGVDMYAAGNLFGRSVFFKYAVLWDRQRKLLQVAAAEIAKQQMIARDEHWGRLTLFKAEYFTEYMLKWIERTAPGLLGDYTDGLGPAGELIASWQLDEAVLGEDDKEVKRARKRARKARKAAG